ncbi:MAG: hypothetical protein BJ554DRAFT_2106 [Olpidium bornovanus]|uniref:Uncharacterized protein n=1 Tax=Olpidium bornovanus TaxID=278681 RepID=A0A8H8DGK0_9FUNG|nr:MAG: hypothetical protein BJ554DRAFT_2106 [Olpidium bornovanus]
MTSKRIYSICEAVSPSAPPPSAPVAPAWEPVLAGGSCRCPPDPAGEPDVAGGVGARAAASPP